MVQMVIPLDGAFPAITGFEVRRQKHTGKLAASLCTIYLSFSQSLSIAG